MPYRFLAEQFSELERFVSLVDEMKTMDSLTDDELADHYSLSAEVERIKACSAMHVQLFGTQADVYFRRQIIKIDGLIINLLEMIFHLPEFFLMTARERYKYDQCMHIKEELYKLTSFYESFYPVIKEE